MAESYPNGKKTLWEKEKLLVTSNFSFSHSVFKRLVSQRRLKVSLCGNGLKGEFNGQTFVVSVRFHSKVDKKVTFYLYLWIRKYRKNMTVRFSKQQILDSSKRKEFADNNFKFAEMAESSSKWVENTVWKQEIAWYEQFFLSHSVFKNLVLQTLKNPGLFGKGLMSGFDNFYLWARSYGMPDENKMFPWSIMNA